MALIDNEELNQGSELEAVEQQEAAKAAEPEAPKVPSKYQGKSLEEIVQMHQEAERLIGRQAQEVGDVRMLADELLQQPLSKKQATHPQVENEYDFLEQPKKPCTNAVASYPDVLYSQPVSRHKP